MKITVLLVEDDFDTLHPLSELLTLRGYNVVSASDAEAGFKIAREHRPDLIITDIALPGHSGLKLISNVRGHAAIMSIPIIVISGCGPMILVEAESAGADICLEKPIDLNLLWAAMDHLSARSEGNADHAVKSSADQSPNAPGNEASNAAAEMDHLIDELRRSTSRDEREEYVRRLKQTILKPNSQQRNCA